MSGLHSLIVSDFAVTTAVEAPVADSGGASTVYVAVDVPTYSPGVAAGSSVYCVSPTGATADGFESVKLDHCVVD